MDETSEVAAALWSLHVRHDSSMELSVSCLLGDAFGPEQNTMSQSFPVGGLESTERAAAADLFAEMSREFPAPPAPRVVRGVELRMTSVLHLNHNLDWPSQPPRSRLVLSREVVEGPDRGTRSVELEIAEVTQTAQQAVRMLDEFAVAASRRFVDEAIRRLSGSRAPDAAPTEPWRIFVSYRRFDRNRASHVYSAFKEYGKGAFFRPYLDDHDLPAGELERRLKEAISKSHIVVGVATRSYAPTGSWSRREVDLATAMRIPLIPLVVGDERPSDWPDWRRYVVHTFAADDDLSSASPSFGRLANLCLRTVERPRADSPGVADGVVNAVERGEVSVQLRVHSIELSGERFSKGDSVRVWLRAAASPFPISLVRVCYGRVGIGVFRTCPEMSLLSGTAEEGEWVGSFIVSEDWPTGEWVLQEASIRNRFGFESSIDPVDWARQGGGGSRFVVR